MTTFTIDPRILEAFPATKIGVLWISNLNNNGKSEKILSLLRAEEARQAQLLATTELPSLPEIKVWRDAYKKFGSDPRDFRSSVESLLRRARAGNKPLPQINNLVDIYNYISIKYHMPVGAEDLKKTTGPIRLTFATGSEVALTLGSKEPEACSPGEVIYRDDENFICRRWNWREADRTKIDENTTEAILCIDSVGGVSPEALPQALDETAALMQSELGATCRSEIR